MVPCVGLCPTNGAISSSRPQPSNSRVGYHPHSASHSRTCHAPDRRESGNKRCFWPSVRLSVCPSLAYIANNSRTQRPSVPKFGMKVPHLRCDSHTSFKVKRSKVRLEAGGGISCWPCTAARPHCLSLLFFACMLSFLLLIVKSSHCVLLKQLMLKTSTEV